MCQRKCNAVTEKLPISETELRQAIDYRVGQKLAEREFFQRQYVRGIWDCLYVLIVVACFAYTAYLCFWQEE